MWHPGPRVYAVADVQVGDLLLDGSRTQFDQPNLTRVVSVAEDGRGFGGLFVDLDEPGKKRLASDREFFVWDFHLKTQTWRKAQTTPYREPTPTRSRLSPLADAG